MCWKGHTHEKNVENSVAVDAAAKTMRDGARDQKGPCVLRMREASWSARQEHQLDKPASSSATELVARRHLAAKMVHQSEREIFR